MQRVRRPPSCSHLHSHADEVNDSAVNVAVASNACVWDLT
jgi:hypothetical protein